MNEAEWGRRLHSFRRTVEAHVSKLRKVENESEARRYLARVEAAEVSLKAWAQAHGDPSATPG